MIETAVDGVILIDARGRVLTFNPACVRLFGYAAAEVVGNNVKMLMPEPFHGEHDGYLKNYRDGGEPKIIGIGREVVGRRKDGSTFPMDLSVGEAIEESGESIFVGIIHDLTERKKAERALRESSARMRAVVETAVDGVILIDAKGIVQMFNPACQRLFGYAAAEVIGNNVKMLMPEPYRGQHDVYLDNYHRTGDPKIIGIGREVVGRRKDGTTFPMDLSVGEARQDGAPVFVGMIHDLTERKRTEEQLIQAQKMEAVGQLSGGIAHDFNNLLTVIVGNADLLAHALKMRPDLQKQAEAIAAAGHRGAELTQRLLAFSRRQTLRPCEIDCNGLVANMHGLLRRAVREDIDIRTDLERDLWAAFADPAQLESAILNLALNARDAMPNGGTLSIVTANMPLDEIYHGVSPEVNPGNYVMISVTDDGEGMPPDVAEHAFEPFFTTKDVGKGSGLGLSMVYGFAKQSNGHVTLYSDSGLGTTVRVYLPAMVDAGSETVPRQATGNGEVAAARGEVVLVVEDDPFVRTYAVGCLEDLGYRVVSAADGREALKCLTADSSIEIVFTDVVMPGGVSGIDLAEKAQILRPDIGILLTSGYALDTLMDRGRFPPGMAFLNKPYRKHELSRVLRRVIAHADDEFVAD